jgi:hypothetical protein
MRSDRVVLALLAAGFAALPLEAGAALDGPVTSIDVDQTHMKAQRLSKAQAGYTVHEMTVPSGTVVREFVATGGDRVFAVSWQGPFMPDLQQLLGSHFAEFTASAAQHGPARGALGVNRPELVVHSGGHMRAFSGFAYVPALVPEGVRIEDLQ